MSRPEHVLSQREIVQNKSSFDTLYKEVQRKDSRNASLAKELKDMRVRKEELERELNTLSVLFQKVNEDKYSFEQQLKVMRENEKTHQSSVTKDSSVVKKLEYSSYMKDRRIDALEKEVDEFRRARHIKEARFSQTLVESDREVVIDNLCDELGKQKSEAHGLALTLAEVHERLMTTQTEYAKTQAASDRVSTLEEECARLTELQSKHMSDLLAMHRQNSAEVEMNTRLSRQIEDLSARLSGERARSAKDELAARQIAMDLSTDLQEASDERDALKSSLTELEANHENLLTLFRLSEEVIASERERAERAEANARERESLLEETEGALLAVHGSLERAQEVGAGLASEQQTQRARERAWAEERDGHRETVDALLREADEARTQRGEALAALRDTIDAVKELSRKLAAETQQREDADRRCLELQHELDRCIRSKAQVTSAILDSLNKEKSRSSMLERTLGEVTLHSERSESRSEESFGGSVDLDVSNATLATRGRDMAKEQTSLGSAEAARRLSGATKLQRSAASSEPRRPSAYTQSSAAQQLQELCCELRRIDDGSPTPMSASRYSHRDVPRPDTDDSAYSYLSDEIPPYGDLVEEEEEEAMISAPMPSPYPEHSIRTSFEVPRPALSANSQSKQLSLFDIVDADLYEQQNEQQKPSIH